MIPDGSVEGADEVSSGPAPSEEAPQVPDSTAGDYPTFSLNSMEGGGIIVEVADCINDNIEDGADPACYNIDLSGCGNALADLGAAGESVVATGSLSVSNLNWANTNMDHIGFSPTVGAGRPETTSAPLNPTQEDWEEEYENETRRLLEDFKCPICLDTLINTVKVDCVSGHKFCNYCIQCWISYERQLVTECPVCRGSILGKTSDPATDSEIKAIFEQFSERTKRTRLRAIRERQQLERHQASPYIPLEYYYQTTPAALRASSFEGHHDLHYQLPLVSGRLPGSNRTEGGGYFELAVGGYSVNAGDNEVRGIGGATARQPLQQQHQLEAGEVVYTTLENFFSPPVAPHLGSTNSTLGTFNGNLNGGTNEVRYHHQNNREPQYSRWSNLYSPTEEAPVGSTSYNSSDPGMVWSGCNYLPMTTPEEPMHQSRSSSVFGVTATPEQRQNLSMNCQRANGHDQYPYHGAAAHGTYDYHRSTMPPVTSSNSRAGQFTSDFFSCSGSVQTPPTHHSSYSTSGFNNSYSSAPGTSAAAPAPKNYPASGPQNPPPPTPFWNRLAQSSTAATNCLNGSRSNGCCNFVPSQSCTNYSMNSTYPGGGQATTSPPPTPRSASNNLEPLMSPRSQQLENEGRNRQRTCQHHHHHCVSEPYPVGNNAAGAGLFSSTASGSQGATGNVFGGQRGSAPQSQAQVSTCPLLSHGSFFTGGFPLYSPRSGFIGFHISHHNPPVQVVSDMPAVTPVPVPPGRITHPIVSLLPLTPDGSSTRVSLTFEVHSQCYHQPQQRV